MDSKTLFTPIGYCSNFIFHEILDIWSTMAIHHPLSSASPPKKKRAMLSANNNNNLHDAGELLASGADGMS